MLGPVGKGDHISPCSRNLDSAKGVVDAEIVRRGSVHPHIKVVSDVALRQHHCARSGSIDRETGCVICQSEASGGNDLPWVLQLSQKWSRGGKRVGIVALHGSQW